MLRRRPRNTDKRLLGSGSISWQLQTRSLFQATKTTENTHVINNGFGMHRQQVEPGQILNWCRCLLGMFVVVFLCSCFNLNKQYQHNVRQLESNLRLPSVAETDTTTLRKPRVVILLSSSEMLGPVVTASAKSKDKETYLVESSIPTDGGFIDQSWFTPNAQDLLFNSDSCEVQYPWQLESFPTCNNFHELDLSTMNFINKGAYRSTFEMEEVLSKGNVNKFVYKTLSSEWDITVEEINGERMDVIMNGQRLDALVMERSSSSEFIPYLHGYCSSGLIMDFMSEGTIWDYVESARIAKMLGDSSGILSSVDKLRAAIHIATGVRDLHEIGDVKHIPAFYHNDIYSEQFLFHGGIFKLNDFNMAAPITLQRTNTTENELCLRDKSSFSAFNDVNRPLEELLGKADDPRFEPFSGDKGDIFTVGNVMYVLLTEQKLFEKQGDDEGRQALLAGKRSPYPDDENSTDPAHIAVRKAIEMCWIEEWRERPSARMITDYLLGELRDITGEATPDLRITLPRLTFPQPQPQRDGSPGHIVRGFPKFIKVQ